MKIQIKSGRRKPHQIRQLLKKNRKKGSRTKFNLGVGCTVEENKPDEYFCQYCAKLGIKTVNGKKFVITRHIDRWHAVIDTHKLNELNADNQKLKDDMKAIKKVSTK